MRPRIILSLLIPIILALAVVWLLTMPAPVARGDPSAATPTSSPSATSSPSPTSTAASPTPSAPTPAPSAASATVSWATKWHRADMRAQLRYNFARWWFDAKPVSRVYKAPQRADTDAVWSTFGSSCKAQERSYRRLYARLCYRTEHPRRVVSAFSWRPLVRRFWPRALVERALRVIRDESGGLPWKRNPSGASGLFQLLPGPAGWQIPKVNVRYAYLQKYLPALRACGDGWEPWAASGEGR